MNVLICGATSYGNKGDDAIRNIMAEHLVSLGVNVKVTRPYPQKELIEWADKVVIGGGGILYDHEGANFEYFFKQYLGWAIELKKEVCLCAIGFQCVLKPENVEYLKSVIDKISFISVRHQQDKDLFKELGITENVIVADDLGFLVKPSAYTFTNKSTKPKICIIPHKEYLIQDLVWLIEELKDYWDIYTVITSYEDYSTLCILRDAIGKESSVRSFCYLTENEIVSLLGEMDYVLSARFHGLVFAKQGSANIFTLGRAYKVVNQITPDGFLFEDIFAHDLESIMEKLIFTTPKLILNNNSTEHLDLLTKFVNN